MSTQEHMDATPHMHGHQVTATDVKYPMPKGMHVIPQEYYDSRPDDDIDQALLQYNPVCNDKNIWFFWHTGFRRMHGYTQRNVRAWHRRLSKCGWTIRVLDCEPGSPLNVSNYLDVKDPQIFPQAFIDGRIGGDHAPQHTSDLVRFPLLIKYGGVYADVGLMQIGDLNRLWEETIGNPDSPYEVLSYDGADVPGRALTNYFMCAGRNNPLWMRCHALLLELFAADGGKATTEGMHKDPLVHGPPVMTCPAFVESDGRKINEEEAGKMLTDYIIQGRVISMVLGLIDSNGGWNGNEYAANHVYAIEFMVGAQLINEMTAWDGQRAFDLMTLAIVKAGEEESPDQRHAREIVEACLVKSFGFKLATGMILKVFGDTLGSLWRKHEGSDDVPGTYGHWLRYGILHWCQNDVPPPIQIPIGTPYKRGPLLHAEQK